MWPSAWPGLTRANVELDLAPPGLVASIIIEAARNSA
jgi:hypothetical protein